jgi:FkbM family methyltransferase
LQRFGQLVLLVPAGPAKAKFKRRLGRRRNLLASVSLRNGELAGCFVMICGVKTLAQSILRPFGLRLVRLKSAPANNYGAGVLFSVLKRFGFSPKHIVDVGANHGNWTRTSLQYFPEAQYTLLEPQQQLVVHIQDLLAAGRPIRWINAGASDKSGTLPFFVSHRDDSSSFVEAAADSSAAIPVQVVSLDDLLLQYELPVPELVKIDAEGFDLKVMKGARTLLGKTDVFLLEASVLCPFENSVASALQFMAEHGYHLIDITEINRSPKDNVLWLTELAFLRNGSSLLSVANSYE